VALIERGGGRARAFPADVVDGTAVDRAFTEVERALGPVDLLVNNAGVVARSGPSPRAMPARGGARSK
jgi:NAD(P)-dependent dehydrogenase (short-subunit alcohol dehydrogenase family)